MRWRTSTPSVRRSARSTGRDPGPSGRHPLLDGLLDEHVVVRRDEAVDPGLEESPRDRVERLVGLAEGQPRAALTDLVQLVPPRGLRPQGLPHRLVAGVLVGPRGGDDLPGPPRAAAQEVAGHAEPALAHEADTVLITGVDDLDPHVAVLDHEPFTSRAWRGAGGAAPSTPPRAWRRPRSCTRARSRHLPDSLARTVPAPDVDRGGPARLPAAPQVVCNADVAGITFGVLGSLTYVNSEAARHTARTDGRGRVPPARPGPGGVVGRGRAVRLRGGSQAGPRRTGLGACRAHPPRPPPRGRPPGATGHRPRRAATRADVDVNGRGSPRRSGRLRPGERRAHRRGAHPPRGPAHDVRPDARAARRDQTGRGRHLARPSAPARRHRRRRGRGAPGPPARPRRSRRSSSAPAIGWERMSSPTSRWPRWSGRCRATGTSRR